MANPTSIKNIGEAFNNVIVKENKNIPIDPNSRMAKLISNPFFVISSRGVTNIF